MPIGRFWVCLTDYFIEKKTNPLYEALIDSGVLSIEVFDSYSTFEDGGFRKLQHSSNLVNWLERHHLYCIGDADKPEPITLMVDYRYKCIEIEGVDY